jgi:hypothetical protein
VPVDECGHPSFGEGSYRLLPALFGEEPQRGHGEVVVGVPEAGPPLLGQQEELGRATPAALTPERGLPAGRLTVGHQHVYVSAHRRGAQAQLLRDRGRGDRTLLQEEPCDGVPGAPVVPRGHHGRIHPGVFHNTSVAYFPGTRKDRPVSGDPSHAIRPVATLPT